ncbi:MAG: cysteine--tRNA ligase, partial [Deltaproteobacteria bacterium]
MALFVYNTLNRKKEEFLPLNPPVVRMYVCGVTVYDLCHIGHARSLVVFDVIYRYLRYRGFRVKYVRNFTDLDDKIIARALDEGVGFQEISERYIREFYADTDPLGLERPSVE